jgi:hypothetical protein
MTTLLNPAVPAGACDQSSPRRCPVPAHNGCGHQPTGRYGVAGHRHAPATWSAVGAAAW